MVSSSVLPCVAVAVVCLCVSAVDGHANHFKGNFDWQADWPQPPETHFDPEVQALPDLSGVWTGSPLGGATHRYFFTKSGGGFGSAKDVSVSASDPVSRPGTSYAVKCLTSDFRGGKPGGCGWDKAVCVLSASNVTAKHRSGGEATQYVADSVTATCSFYTGGQETGQLSGPVVKDGCGIDMKLPWNKFCGPMSGLWHGPAEGDIYVLGHNETTGNITVWWDSDVTPVGGWAWGHGVVRPNLSMYFAFPGFVLSGVVNANYSEISPGPTGNWSGNWVKRPQQFFPADIHTVHLVFMNHLDVGYASYINNIDNEYFHQYFPQAIRLANEMRALEGTDRFVYVTHTWLMSFFLNCPCPNDPNCTALSLNNPYAAPLKCPSEEAKANFTAALKRNDIVWHAEPFDLQAENMSPQLFEAGVLECKQYDAQFYGKNQTTTMSDRDVIYVTRSVIPLLAKHGIRGITIGSNGANYPPQVPKLHLWRDEQSGTEAVVAYHPYGYGGYSKSTCAGPGQCGDCAEAPNGVALCTEFRTDNSGPPTGTTEVLASLDAVRKEYPGASVFASTFDKFVEDVWPIRDQLPVVTKEVGDTWMYGASSDPLKMAQNREIQRVWIECMASGNPACDYANPTIRNMTRFLLKAPEHTWGIPGVQLPASGNRYVKNDFLAMFNTSGLLQASATWAEQRIFNELAVRALEEDGHPIAEETRRRVDALGRVQAPDVSGMSPVPVTTPVVLPKVGVKVGVDAATGGLSTLEDMQSKVQWASASAQLAAVAYHPYNDTDWLPFLSNYINGGGRPGGFWKPDSNNFSESTYFQPVPTAAYTSDTSYVVALNMPTRAHARYGAPEQLFLNATFSRSAGALQVQLELTWINKAATMVGETTQILFRPAPQRTKPWAIDVLGSSVDPENVQDGGNQFQHGTWDGVTGTTASGTMHLQTLDAPAIMPMTADFPFGNALPAGSSGLKQLAPNSVFGVGVNLHNNLWSTNYPQFYPYYDPQYCSAMSPSACADANLKFRFVLTLTPSKDE
eukprot:m.8335 g.8335  ORF g.8335 m.8335 type:complete len:1021 (+) comp3196_c0_seq1:59-3121(+)